MKAISVRRREPGSVVLVVAVLATCIVLSGCDKEPAQTLTVVFTNDMLGSIHPCDCPGQEWGGFARRATLVNAVRDTTANALLLDGGDFFGRGVDFGRVKAEVVTNSMALMGYHGVAIGESDLGFGVDYIVDQVNMAGLPVLAANLYNAATGELVFAPSSWVDFPDGPVVGLIGVMGKGLKVPPQVPKGSLKITEPAAAVEREIAAFGDDVDVVVVLAHLRMREAQQLAKEVPAIDLIVCGHEGSRLRDFRRFGNAYILQVPKEGKHAGVAFAVLDGEGGIRDLTGSLMPLSDWYEDDKAVAELIRERGL